MDIKSYVSDALRDVESCINFCNGIDGTTTEGMERIKKGLNEESLSRLRTILWDSRNDYFKDEGWLV
jgi:hypothetical protein